MSGDHAWCTPGSCSRPRVRDDHPMHPLVDADGRITATGEEFVQRAGEIMDEAVAKSGSGDNHNQADAIVCVPGIRSGAPTLAGTRYTVALVAGLVRDGLDNDEIRDWYPAATDWHLDAVRAEMATVQAFVGEAGSTGLTPVASLTRIRRGEVSS